MKRSGIKRLTYAEALEKKNESRDRQREKFILKQSLPKVAKPKAKKKVKYPTILGIKGSRYIGLKGVLWTIFSMYTRKRDFILYRGRCVSCVTRVQDWHDFDAGHYVSVSRGNFETLFDEKNVHGQCKRCNNPTWTPDAAIPFAYEIDRRLGKGTAEDIYFRSNKVGKEYSELEYMRAIEHYKHEFDILEA